jgi:4'-phosphopantetheinyl transferase
MLRTGVRPLTQCIPVSDYELEQIPCPIRGVDIWAAPIAVNNRKLAQLASLHSNQERERNRSSHQQVPAGLSRYSVTQGLLRTILAKYLHVDPATIEFEYGVAGKPYLAANGSTQPLKFNLSHSGGTALVAVTRENDIGIDIEHMTLGRDLTQLAENSLTRSEWKLWSNAINASQRKIFYRLWVRKEAYLKGTGTGLSFPVNRVDVSVASYRPDHTVTVPFVDGKPAPWSIYDLDLPGRGGTTVAAIAIAGASSSNDDPVEAHPDGQSPFEVDIP